MATHGEISEKTIRVSMIRHQKTGLLVAISDDLPGLMVAGHTQAEVARKIPTAIRMLLEAEGKSVVALDAESTNKNLPDAFASSSFIAHARFQAAA